MAIETNGTPVIMGGNDGFGFGNGGFMAFLIFALLMGNGGFGGWGNNGFANAIGYENLATSNEVQRGFDNQNSMANQREILSAVNDASARGIQATNQTFHDTLMAMNDKYSELQRDIANVAMAEQESMAKQQECCCNTLRAIDGVNYNNAMNTASINANTTAQTQKILDAITGNRMADMQNQINQLQLAQALSGVVRYPNGMTYNAGTSPFCNCGGCSCMA
jgi:hypothetical protein